MEEKEGRKQAHGGGRQQKEANVSSSAVEMHEQTSKSNLKSRFYVFSYFILYLKSIFYMFHFILCVAYRLHEERTCKRHAHAPATAEIARLTHHHLLAKAQTLEKSGRI